MGFHSARTVEKEGAATDRMERWVGELPADSGVVLALVTSDERRSIRCFSVSQEDPFASGRALSVVASFKVRFWRSLGRETRVLQSAGLRILKAPSAESRSFSICGIDEGIGKSLLPARWLLAFP